MLRIAIVEDDPQEQQLLADYIHRYERETSTAVSLSVFEDGDQIAADYRPSYDLILLDIQMPRMDGMATAAAIRKADPNVILVFITNMAQYAIQGYEFEAMSYLLKPLGYFAFSQLLQKAARRLERSARFFLTLPGEGSLHRVDAAEIYYIESEGHKVRIYTREGELVCPGSLKSMEEKLSGHGFARCNSGYLVNLAQVRGVENGLVTTGPYRLQISRPRRKPFMAALTDYIGGQV